MEKLEGSVGNDGQWGEGGCPTQPDGCLSKAKNRYYQCGDTMREGRRGHLDTGSAVEWHPCLGKISQQ